MTSIMQQDWLYLLAYGAVFMLCFWYLFIAVMGLKTHWKSLHIVAKVLAVPGVLVAWLIDLVLNIPLGLIALEFDQFQRWREREYTMSQRFGRWKYEGGAKRWVAWTVCEIFLDCFDAGKHCK